VKLSTLIAIALMLLLVWIATPGRAQAQRSRNFNLNIEGNAERCSDLKIRTDGQLARSEETFTLQKSEASLLDIEDTSGHGVIRARGWDNPQYSVEVCKIAVAGDQGSAQQLLRSMAVARSAGRITTNSPNPDGQYQFHFFVNVPRDGNLSLATKNGPIDVANVGGTVKVRATNGPIALKDIAGRVEANTSNGPIAFSGKGGDVVLRAQNGPISLNLVEDIWSGAQLDAKTVNGPVSISIPDTFRSGVRIETSGHAPMSCASPLCRAAWSDASRRVIQFNGSSDTVRVGTENGPVSIASPRNAKVRVM
jgi:DUF4097 and DUF4098 domain-containing protein YvlB